MTYDGCRMVMETYFRTPYGYLCVTCLTLERTEFDVWARHHAHCMARFTSRKADYITLVQVNFIIIIFSN